jgi:hypothetical protein
MPPWTNGHNEDIQMFTALGVIVNNDNLSALENIPPSNEPPFWLEASNNVIPADGWSFQGTYPQKSNNHPNCGLSINKPGEIWL